ncbi:MAG: hypothetical protein K1X95_03135 [Acidimicrobiia bacterium]|nr:hypothetical protein [Acidimicrobiia bacterium]
MFFFVQTVVILVGAVLHILLDRKPNRHTKRRTVELLLIWFVAAGGVMAILGGIGHVGPDSAGVAAGIGYEPSMFQWEVGWADIAIGVAGFVCIWKRDSWMTCAVVVLAISYGGDAIGHVMQYVAHANTAPNNVWAIPSDIMQPLLVVGLLVAYRMLSRREAAAATEAEGAEAPALAEAAAADASA